MSTCRECGAAIPAAAGSGRPRQWCQKCRPPRPEPRPERLCACGCGAVLPPGGKAKFASASCRNRAWWSRNRIAGARRRLRETEAQFQDAVLDLAVVHGWEWWHDHDSRRNPAGWPDLILCRPPRLIAAELNVSTRTTTVAQRAWLRRLADCGVEAVVMRPDPAPAAEQWPVVDTMEPVTRDGRDFSAGRIELRLMRPRSPGKPL